MLFSGIWGKKPLTGVILTKNMLITSIMIFFRIIIPPILVFSYDLISCNLIYFILQQYSGLFIIFFLIFYHFIYRLIPPYL